MFRAECENISVLKVFCLYFTPYKVFFKALKLIYLKFTVNTKSKFTNTRLVDLVACLH
jgi:hypothetical protein